MLKGRGRTGAISFIRASVRHNESLAGNDGLLGPGIGSLFVCQGNGVRDRFVPIGQRALTWTTRYLDDVRPGLERGRRDWTMFLGVSGGPLAPDFLSRMVGAYVRAGAPQKRGSCHLFRHTTATLMLDAGADVRYIAEMLGHRKFETTMGYTRVSKAELQEVYAMCHPAEQGR